MHDDENETPAAAILPRGLALVASDQHKGRRRLARSLHHLLITHIGTGVAGYGLPNIPGRQGLMIYRSDKGAEHGGKRIRRLIEKDKKGHGSIRFMTGVGAPLGAGGLDKRQEEVLAENFSRVGVVGYPGIDLVSETPLRDVSDRVIAAQYLANLAQMAETTIVAMAVGDEMDEHLGGRIWVLPELAFTTWSAHVLPTDIENEHQIRIVSNNTIHVQIVREETPTGFRQPQNK